MNINLKTKNRKAAFALAINCTLIVSMVPSTSAGPPPELKRQSSVRWNHKNNELAQRLTSAKSETAITKKAAKYRLYTEPNAVVDLDHPTFIQLKSGEIIVSAKEETIVKCPSGAIFIDPESIGLISTDSKVCKVRNLGNKEKGKIRINLTVGGKTYTLDLHQGEESIFFENNKVDSLAAWDNAGRRAAKIVETPEGAVVWMSEISISSLKNSINSPCLYELMNSQKASDKEISRIISRNAELQEHDKRGVFYYRKAPKRDKNAEENNDHDENSTDKQH